MQRREFLTGGMMLGAAGSGLLLAACARAGGTLETAAPAGRVRPQRPLRLASNENPLGLSPAARRAIIEQLGDGNRYPRQERQALIEALSAKHGLPADHIQLGAGSTEILQMAVQATAAGTTIVTADPTFEDVGQYAAASGRRVQRVRLRADWAHDIERMRRAAAGGPALVFICNPNNPTATITPGDEVDDWIASSDERTTFLVDEAYVEYAEDPRYRSVERWVRERPNVVVVRTFSKIHAMAGLRLGYALAQPAAIRRLRLWSCNNNANQLVLAAARASLADTAFERRSLDVNRAGRRILFRGLDELGLAHLPSHANFVMHRIPGDQSAYIARMRERDVLVGRAFPPLVEYSRVSIGLPEEMEAFVGELRGFRAVGGV